MTDPVIPDSSLSERVAQALREAAHLCPNDCGLTETACRAEHPVQVSVLGNGGTTVEEITGPVTVLADIAMHALRKMDTADRPTPPDTRPYRRASAPGHDLTVRDATDRIDLHQVGWHGQTGAFYALDEDPSQYERGSWGPLYVISHTDRLADLAPDAEQQRIADRIRAELVCCDIYGRVNDTHELTLDVAKTVPGWHDLCYWGEAAARIAEDDTTDLPDETDGTAPWLPPASNAMRTAPARTDDVQGRCPACGAEALFLGEGGYVTCARDTCPQPDAASTLLERPAPPDKALRCPDHPDAPTFDGKCGGCTVYPADMVKLKRCRAEQDPEVSPLRVRSSAVRLTHEAVRTRLGALLPVCGAGLHRPVPAPDGSPVTCLFCNGTEKPITGEAGQQS